MAGMFLCLAVPVFGSEPVPKDDLEGLKITHILITTQRIKEEVIRKKIPVKEGDAFSLEAIQQIRQRLNEMRFFKKVEVSFEKDPSQNGVQINIHLEEGWFLIPLPFYTGGGGGSYGSLMLIERNIFKRAESVFFFGGGNQDGGFGSVGFQLNKFLLSANYGNRTSTEWGYADRGFNSGGRFRSSRSESSPEKFGTIQNQYDRNTEEKSLQTRFPLTEKMGGFFGVSSQIIGYKNLALGSLPTDQGTVNSVSTGFSFSTRRPDRVTNASFSFQDLGAVFGFGLADLSERIKPLPGVQTFSNADIFVTDSDRAYGSDFNFTKANAGGLSSVTFPDHQRILLRVKGGMSVTENLPLSQKFATNRELSLRGNYAREFRGDRGVGSSLDFSYPFRRTPRGVWTGELFADAATVWDSGASNYKEGLGLGFWYQFWRFPIPLGLTYSYSLDDRDSEVNFAFGSRF